MPAILVSGLINIETTLRVDGFPLHYTPVQYPFYGVNVSVSGVGYNFAKALTRFGDPVCFLSLIGRDIAESHIRSELAAAHILFLSDESLPATPEDWAKQILQAFGPEILVIGLGAQGAFLSVAGIISWKGFPRFIPARWSTPSARAMPCFQPFCIILPAPKTLTYRSGRR